MAITSRCNRGADPIYSFSCEWNRGLSPFFVKDSLPNSMPSSLKENISVIFGAAASEGVGPLVIAEEKKDEK